MSSSVFFKFKSQKEPTRVEFDGTGISVFELKREIITKSGLGDGTDFDLHIYTDDNSEEYDDDTTIIPRSTTVIARRQPAIKPGAGRAARYVSGKMPVAAKNASRKEQSAKASSSKPSATALNQMSNAMTEEERMAAMFNAQTEQWSAQQEELSHQAPVYKPGAKPGRPANVPDHEPPTGYICYRCGQKGHWIQLCPTNDDPEFDNRPRVKRTTGIPRSFLQKVDKSVVMAQTEGDESKRPAGIMVNAEGDFVIAEPDKASWEQFQAKTKSSSAANETAAADKEIQERGLECSIDKKMFIEPMKTPCCEKTFCNDCITNALIESDFVCPACQTEAVLIDDLVPDDEASKKIQEYLKEKELAKPEPANSPKPDAEEASKEESKEDQDSKVDNNSENKDTQETTAEDTKTEKSKSPTPSTATKSPEATKASPATSTAEVAKANDPNSKKRPADDVLENPKIPKGPRAMQNQQPQNNMNMMNGMGMNNMMFPGMPMMPNMMGMPNMNMNMNNMNNMNMGMGMGMPMMGMPMMGMPGFNNNFGNMNNGWNNNMGNMNMGMGMGMGMNGNGFQNGGGNFNNQGSNGGGPQDEAYFRQPVNPHRHQNKQKRVRPSDYREL